MAGPPVASQIPPLKETFQAGVRDYNAARYDVAAGEFQDVIHYYPLDDLAALPSSIWARSLTGIRTTPTQSMPTMPYWKASAAAPKPPAQLRKGLALLQMNKREAGIHELRSLIQRHPQTPEASQARSKLNGMGVRAVAR